MAQTWVSEEEATLQVSGWLVREDANGDDHWALIGRRDPQLPQMFVPVANNSLVISRGDLLTARCHMKNDEDRLIEIGPTGEWRERGRRH